VLFTIAFGDIRLRCSRSFSCKPCGSATKQCETASFFASAIPERPFLAKQKIGALGVASETRPNNKEQLTLEKYSSLKAIPLPPSLNVSLTALTIRLQRNERLMARDEEEGNTTGFKVVDKRRFSDSGDSRSEGGEAEEKLRHDPKPEAKPTQSQSASGGRPVSSRDEGAPGIDFSSFIVSMATRAMMLIGEIPDSQSGRTSENFEAAKQMIDILGIIQEKTQGNLTDDEAKLLEEILSNLRLAFVGKVQRQRT
jgi:hypothetical protein